MSRKLFILLFIISGTANAFGDQEAKIVRESVLELCRGGHKLRSVSSIDITGNATAKTVLFKKLVNARMDGKVSFTKTEWDGIAPLLPEKYDSSVYVKCVTDLTPVFMDKFSVKK